MLDQILAWPYWPYFARSPSAGSKVEKNEERPGGAANVAMNIASLGGHAHLVGFDRN